MYGFYNTKQMLTNLQHTKSQMYYIDNYKNKMGNIYILRNCEMPTIQNKCKSANKIQKKERNGATMCLCMVVLAR